MKSGSLWNYYRDEVNNVKDNASHGKSFKYNTKITGKTEARPAQGKHDGELDQRPQDPKPTSNIEVTILLKYLKYF